MNYTLGRVGTTTLVILFFGAWVFTAQAWSGPTASAPNSNISAPVNIGSTGQYKAGNLGISGYLNFSSTLGTSGYGIRDNAGILEFKNSGGGWSSIQNTIFSLSGGSQWTTSGSNIYYIGGNVGVGTANPSAPLQVTGSGATASLGYNGYALYTGNTLYASDYYVAARGLWASQLGRLGSQYVIVTYGGGSYCSSGSVLVGYNTAIAGDGGTITFATCQWINQ